MTAAADPALAAGAQADLERDGYAVLPGLVAAAVADRLAGELAGPFDALPPAVARDLPEPLQRLIGYELKGSMTLGWLDGGDPGAVLE